MENVKNEYNESFKGGKDMMRHLIKLAWNRRKKNFILAIELLVSFLVLFAVFSIGVDFFRNYMQYRGFEYEKVYKISMDWQNENNKVIQQKKEQIALILSQNPEIENFSFASNNVPYGRSIWRTGFKYNNRDLQTDIFYVDDSFFDVLGIKITNGKMFSKLNDADKLKPIVVNDKLAGEIAGKGSAIGKTLVEGILDAPRKEFKIIGTYGNYKYSNDFEEIIKQVFVRTNRLDTTMNLSTILIKSKDGTNALFEQKLQSEISRIAQNWTIEISLLKEDLSKVNQEVLLPFIIFIIVAGFLIFNVVLGIFGVLWYNISQRKPEIGLRRAMGSTIKQIKFQFIGEMWALASLSIIVGVFVAIQFPLLGVFNVKPSIYLESIFLSIIFIFILVTVCAFYPSTMAAKIEPANSLREE
jgi:putative ABC transport system permease protein